MTPSDLKQIIQQGEGLIVEFKEARNSLPKNTFETVCSFLNRQGGHLILGVRDDGALIGVDPLFLESLKRDFTALSNNPNKLNPPFLLELTEVSLDGHLLLYVYVPQSSQAHRCDGVMFDRSHEGDFKVNDHTSVSRIFERKNAFYSESRIYSYLGLSEFKPGILDRVRQLISSHAPAHPWLGLPDQELLRSAGLYQKDYQSGIEGYTLAAALLLGRDDVIQSILPHYRIDAIVRRDDVDRYDDRIDIRTNLIEAYETLMLFVTKHLPDRFYLNNNQRISLRDIIFREIVANLIVHREYTNGTPARFIIYADRVETDNANKPIGFGPINPEKFSPFPKNPNIAKFFVQLGRVEELGSGIRNVARLLQYYHPNHVAQFIEEDVFRAIVPVPGTIDVESNKEAAGITTRLEKEIKRLSVPDTVQKRLLEEIALFSSGRAFSAVELSEFVSVNPRTIRRDFVVLINADIIKQTDSFGFYELSDRWNALYPVI